MNRRKMHTATVAWLPKWQPFCTVEGDGGGAGDGGGSAPTQPPAGGAGDPAPAGPDWATFTRSLGELNTALGGKLDTLVDQVKTLPAQMAPPPQDAPPPDLETLTQTELASHIVGTISREVQKQIETALAPLMDQVTGLQTRVVSTDVNRDIERLRGEHKDFNDWKDEMVGLAKQHPTLGISQLYNLARSENAAKARELDTKYTPPAPPRPPRFGGLLPAGNGSGASGNGATPPLSGRDAAVEAYREVSAKYPGVLAALETM